jgi:hypothetical protein
VGFISSLPQLAWDKRLSCCCCCCCCCWWICTRARGSSPPHPTSARSMDTSLRLSPVDRGRGSLFCAPPTVGPTSETQTPAHPLQQELAYARASSPAASSRWLPPLRGTGEIKVCSRRHSRRCECWVARWGSFCFPLGCWAPFGSADNPSSAAGSTLPSPATSDRPLQDRLVCCLFCASYWR